MWQALGLSSTGNKSKLLSFLADPSKAPRARSNKPSAKALKAKKQANKKHAKPLRA